MKNQNKTLMTAAMLGLMVAGLGVCATPLYQISEFDKTGKGIVYAAVGWNSDRSPEELCQSSAGLNNGAAKSEACKNTNAYYGRMARIKNTGNSFAILIPKDIQVNGGDIVKVQLVDNAPGIYQGTFGRILPGFQRTKPCYDTGNPFSGGIECPEFNWSYKDY